MAKETFGIPPRGMVRANEGRVGARGRVPGAPTAVERSTTMKATPMPEVTEPVTLDLDRLCKLCRGLPPREAEDLVCGIADRIVVHLAEADGTWRAGDGPALLAQLDALGGYAPVAGMLKLARVIDDCRRCLATGDPVALAATLGRMLRVGERSVLALYERQASLV